MCNEEMIAHLVEKYGFTRENALRILTSDEAALDEESEASADRQFAEVDWSK